VAQLAQLRQKIRSIQTTKKITHAVRLVSMSLYNKLEKQDLPLKNYTKNIKNLFVQLLDQAPEWKNERLFPADTTNSNPLIIIIATSKGLCGSLNSNLFRFLDASLFFLPNQQPKFIAIGQRAIKMIKGDASNQMICTYPELNSNNFITIADDLVDKISSTAIPYSSVTFYSSSAISFFSQKPARTQIIPMILDHEVTQDLLLQEEIIWEQDTPEILDSLAVRYLRTSIMHLLFQSLRAEHAARFMAMESSTNNAKKYLDRLTLQLNKLRQALITKEVSELSSGHPR